MGELQKEYAPLVKEEAEDSADAALFEEIAYTTVITKKQRRNCFRVFLFIQMQGIVGEKMPNLVTSFALDPGPIKC